jgi:hypothetical protein
MIVRRGTEGYPNGILAVLNVRADAVERPIFRLHPVTDTRTKYLQACVCPAMFTSKFREEWDPLIPAYALEMIGLHSHTIEREHSHKA